MDWYKLLYSAWKSFYLKKKDGKQSVSPILKSFANNYKTKLRIIEYHLKREDYIFGKWNAIFVPKKDGGKRPLTIPNRINDKIVLKAISDYLSKILSQAFSHVQSISYAYQKGKSTRDALIQLKKVHQPGNILLKIDIRHFFDEIDKGILTQLIEHYTINDYVKRLIQNGINPTIDYSNLKKNERERFPKEGIPQGSPISAVLSNLYLLELDNLAVSNGWKTVRYADDMVFSVPNLKEAQLILSQVEKYLSDNRNLTIHPLGNSPDAKTVIFQNLPKNRMKYLGVLFDGENLYPTKECCATLIGKIKNLLKSSSTPEEKEMNIQKAILQWCGYYAFTDITNKQIKCMSNAINYQINKSKLCIREFNIVDVILKTRKRQKNRFANLFHPMQFGEEFNWLNFYD